MSRIQIAAVLAVGLLAPRPVLAKVEGVSGPSVTLTAKEDRIATPDGNSIYIWGFTTGARAQYPAPTVKVTEGDVVTIKVVNSLPAKYKQNVSLTVAGLSGLSATCDVANTCVQGPITLEAPTGASVTYTFTASRPGTFLYNSASRPDLQVEMGLAGAIVVYPSAAKTTAAQAAGFTGQAYDDTYDPALAIPPGGNPAGSQYNHEYLFFLSEMDSNIHDLVETQGVQAVDDSGRLGYYFPNYWFINGRNAPDTFAEDFVERLPTQPYGSFPKTHPSDVVLMRVVGGGHDMHPFHHHGQHARVIGVDGFPLQSSPASTVHFDRSHEVFTIQSVPGQTVDAVLRWTGKDLGWDIYGCGSTPAPSALTCGAPNPSHPAQSCDGTNPVTPDGLDSVTKEFCGDHNKPLDGLVKLPGILSLTNGEFWSGSPFLGTTGMLPPGDGGLNPEAGYTYMWHSHNEKEITNFDIFPGGMMTMLMVLPQDVIIED